MHKKDRPLPQPTGRLIGYARVSTPDQSVDMQLDALRRAGVPEDNLWWETKSGVRAKRPRLELALTQAVRGDTFIVWKLDRFGRSLRDLIEKLDDLDARGIGFRSITEGIDTTTPIGRFAFHMLGAVAQLERDLTVERSRHGVAYARKRGSQIGALPKMTEKQVLQAAEMLKAGKPVAEVARRFSVTRPTLYSRDRLKKIIVKMRERQKREREKQRR